MSHPAPPTPAGRIDPADAPEFARHFQHYEVLRRDDGSPWELGRGTMGITYKAFDVNLCCEVALKVVNSALLDHPKTRERFVREARAAAALRHRNVASVYHLGNDGERFFYAMELIDGETLDALVRRQGPLPVEAALRIILQAARALAAADRQKLVHRDIKPANLMVVHEDADDHMLVKVIDFGLARPASGGGTSTGHLTAGGFVGTPQFASPEQLEERTLDTRSDIYSLGVTTWFLLTGRVPFAGSLATVCQQHLTKPPPWDQLPDWLPEPMRRLLAHMLEKEPANRPQNAVELRREIEDCLKAVRSSPLDNSSLAAGIGSLRSNDRPGESAGSPPKAGTILLGRYELTRLVREGRRGRMFEARDESADAQPVTVTFPPAELLATEEQCERLHDEVRLVQASSHPHLVQVLAFERPARGTDAFLVEERINGGSLVDLLAARGSSLPAAEALRLLGQIAAAADHAASRRLEHLDLAIHQVRLHFFPSSDGASSAPDPHEHLAAAMDKWPSWALKINPLGVFRDHSESRTWAGEVTLVPGTGHITGNGTETNPPAALATAYLRELSALIYEVLGGSPNGMRGKFVSLPALNEEANAVLQRACGEQPGFRRSRHFYEALARAAGFDPANLHLATTGRPDGPPSSVGSAVVPDAPSRPVSDVRPRPVASHLGTEGSGGMTFQAGPHLSSATRRMGSVAPFFLGEGVGYDSPDDGPLLIEGSISDRLTMVSDDPSSLGRWLLGAVALVSVFVLAVAGVWIMLAQRLPTGHDATASARRPAPTEARTTEQSRRSAKTPRPTVPPPLPAEPVRAEEPKPSVTPMSASHRATDRIISPAATPLAGPELLPSAPPHTPAPMPREKLVSVRIRSIPSGAEIRSEGRVLGTTPCDVDLASGIHELVARFDGWPETRETLTLRDEQSKATAEIHLMPPGLVPSATVPSPSSESTRTRRTFAPPTPARAAHLVPVESRRAVPVTPDVQEGSATDDAAHAPASTPTTRIEPEVRRALPPLTPFDPDGTPPSNDTVKDPPRAYAPDGN